MLTWCDGTKVIKFFLVFFTLVPCIVKGAIFDITAEYKPESYSNVGGRFINTTECIYVHYSFPYCNKDKPFEESTIVRLPVEISRRPIHKNGKADYFGYFRVSGPKKVTLSNGVNSFQLTFIPTYIGAEAMEMHVPRTDDERVFDGVEGDCYHSFVSLHWITPREITRAMFLHSIHPSAQQRSSECYVNWPPGEGIRYKFNWINYGFKLSAPNPLAIPNGVYTGSLKITIGRNSGDIDLGNGLYLVGREHEFKFRLTVRHQLRVDFPMNEGGTKIELFPVGGWRESPHGQVKGSILQQDLPFHIWFSSPFTVSLRCQYPWGSSDECALKDGKGRTVPLKTYYVDHRNVITNLTTRPYQVVALRQGQPVINAASTIRFQIAAGTVTEMMKYPGSTFKGEVTLIFDAAID
ncbi:hypothetical protein [Aeromonas veronii]|uniref:hypothetical protein n=1 Tax=Aeromonas veronii TaxID=654 RepID=UPI00111789A5|nr:hypothetical protein [Aeromonas veronii]